MGNLDIVRNMAGNTWLHERQNSTMEDQNLALEFKELRHSIQAAVIVLISQKIQLEHPHRPLAECHENALEILQNAITLVRAST
jgi:hypothetical protein